VIMNPRQGRNVLGTARCCIGKKSREETRDYGQRENACLLKDRRRGEEKDTTNNGGRGGGKRERSFTRSRTTAGNFTISVKGKAEACEDIWMYL